MNKGNYLKLYIGCMFSGKSTQLINEFGRHSIITDDIIMVNHIFDSQRRDITITDGVGKIVTHNGKSCVSYMVSKLSELYLKEDYKNAKIIIIDEAQFYEDLYEFIWSELQKLDNKIFIVGGLANNFNMEKIGDINKLIPIADSIIHLNALCVYCKNGNTASFTKRLINNSANILVGKEDIYAPVCRFHYYHDN